MEQSRHVPQPLGKGKSLSLHFIGKRQHPFSVACCQCFENAGKRIAAAHPEHLPHGVFREPFAAVGDGLVEQRQTVAHRTAGAGRQHAQRAGFIGELFLVENVGHMTHDSLRSHVPQVELKAA